MSPSNQGPSSDDISLPRFECTKCGACCRDESILVTVTGHDIVRISAVLGLDSSEMLKALDFYILADGIERPVGLAGTPSVLTERGLAYIALRKMENGDCIFLKEDLCMIHPVRPGVCRSFPFTFSDSKEGISWGLSAKKDICPGLGLGPVIEDDEIRELADSILPELQIFKIFANRWNRTQSCPTATLLLETILSDQSFYN